MPRFASSLLAASLLFAACQEKGDGVQTHNGSLAQGDQTLQSGEFVDVYNVDVKAGQWVLVEMASTAFDPYLILRSPGGNQTENDDSDGSLQLAVVRQQATEAGTWKVSATSAASGESGAYTLKITVSDAEPPMAGAAPATNDEGQADSTAGGPAAAGGESIPDTTEAFVVRPGRSPSAPESKPSPGGGNARTVEGMLQDGDDTLESGEFTDILTLDVQAGQTIRIEMVSDDFDPYLILRAPSGQQEDNDDAGGSTNARIDYRADETGTWRVSFTSASPGETGRYQATVRIQ